MLRVWSIRLFPKCWRPPGISSISTTMSNRLDTPIATNRLRSISSTTSSTSHRHRRCAFSSSANSSSANSSTDRLQPDSLSEHEYDRLCDETLDSLWEVFDRIGDDPQAKVGSEYDVSYAQGVLTIQLGRGKGTYVINKQAPNKQIWLSSPSSGPKRYDMVKGRWIYLHDGVALHDLLTGEIKTVLSLTGIDFTKCIHG